MRRRLVLAAVAATTTIVLAFCIPLARLVRDIARDQAIAMAERDAERVTGALAISLDADAVEAVISSTSAGREGRLGVVFADGSTVGSIDGSGEEIELGRDSPSTFTVDAGDAVLLLAPVELAEGVAVISVRIPDEDLEQGVAEAWLILTGVAVVLLAAGVVIADRVATSVTRPAVALADAARQVADGDLTVRVTPAGPPELSRAARGFNDLASRLSDLIAHERQGVADLAHRLRTPLAAMRLDADGVADPEVRARLADDVTELERAVDTVIREARHPIRRAVTPVSDLAEVSRERVAFWSALAEDQGRPWNVDIPTARLAVGVPREELEAVVDALLDNVFTHTPAQTGFEVSVGAIDAQRARLVVRDHGPGFGASVPGPTFGSTPGRTGLGLDIAARVASAAGGTLEVADEGGAVVALELPLQPADAAVPPAVRRRHRVRERPSH
jgi:signal transduction histidine kinase